MTKVPPKDLSQDDHTIRSYQSLDPQVFLAKQPEVNKERERVVQLKETPAWEGLYGKVHEVESRAIPLQAITERRGDQLQSMSKESSYISLMGSLSQRQRTNSI